MKKLIKEIPLHSFLLGSALIFFLFVHNINIVSLHAIYRSLIISILISILFFIPVFFLLKKDRHKAGVTTTALICIVFCYGFLYDFMEQLFYKGLFPLSHIHRYLVLFLFLFILLLYYFLFKTKRTFQSLTYSLNVFVAILFIINIFYLSVHFMSTRYSSHNKFANHNSTIKFTNHSVANDTFPDIYYIILDGYANDSVLSAFYSYQNNSLTNYLKKTGFYLASSSRANYLVTGESLNSSLNFSYLNNSKDSISISNNKVCFYLKQNGYKIVHVRSGYSVTRENNLADVQILIGNFNEFERILLRYTLFRLDDLMGYIHYRTLIKQLSVIEEVFDITGPKFVFIHIVSPHPPYVCNENGKFKSSPRIMNDWWEPKEDYLTQLKFINSKIENYVSQILQKSNRSPIIILQSDHGPWMKSNSLTAIYNARCLILNAYHIPYGWKNKLYNSITPVNSFPFIFNNLFIDALPMQPDIPMDSIGMMRYTQVQTILND